MAMKFRVRAAAASMAVPALYVVTAALFFQEAVFRGKVFCARDHYLFFLPRRFFALEMLRDGTLPLWNPLNACGVPFLANVQSSVFYPLSALVYLLPFPAGYNAFVIAHYVLAACGMYALLRCWKGSPAAAFIAGLVFAFGGYMQSISDNLAFLTSASWIPLVLLCFSRALQTRARSWTAAAAVLAGVQVLAGDASFCIVSTMLLTGLYALCSWRSGADFPLRLRAALLAAVWAAGLLLAAVVLVPFFEFVRFSDRAAGLPLEESLRWSLHPLELLQFLHPYIFGRLVPDVRWFGQRWLDTVYIGIVPLFLAAFYVVRWRCPRKLFLCCSVLAGLFLALGSYNPLLAFVMRIVPALRLMQYPVKFMLPAAFALSVMSGLGADVFLGHMRKKESLRGILKLLFVPVCALLAVLLAAAAFRAQLFDFFLGIYPDSDYFRPLREARFFEMYRGTFATAVLCGACAVLAWCAARFSTRPALVSCIIGVLVCADLLLLGAPGDPWLGRRELCPPSPVVRVLKQDDSLFRIYSLSRIAGGISYSHTPQLDFDRVYRILTRTLPPNLHMYYSLASADEYSEMLNVRYYEVFGRVLLYLAGHLEGAGHARYSRNVFSMLNVKYIISPRPLPELQFECVHDGPVKIYRNREAWPRAFMADRVVACADDAEVLRRIHAAGFTPQTVFIPRDELDRLPRQLRESAAASGQDHRDDVRFEACGANRIVLRAETRTAGILVLSDTWFPGWRVEVNGRERALLRVNHALRGVALESGSNRVEFVYRPYSFFAGLALSALMLCLLAAWLFSGFVRARRAQGEKP